MNIASEPSAVQASSDPAETLARRHEFILKYPELGLKINPLIRDCGPECRGETCPKKTPTGRDATPKAPHGKLTPNGFEDATSDAETVKRWLSAEPYMNAGLPQGLNGLVALDLDKHGKVNGVAGFEALVNGRELPKTPSQESANGGKHIIFRKPADRKMHGQIKGPDGTVYGEIKDKGYIVVAPSTFHGREYKWLPGQSPWDVEFAEMPDWLQELTSEPSRLAQVEGALAKPLEEVKALGVYSTAAADKFRELCRTWPIAREATNDGELTTRGLLLKGADLGLPPSETLRIALEAYSPKCEPPWDEAELRHKVEGVYKYRKTPVGSESSEYAFAEFAPEVPPALEPPHRWAHIRTPEGFLVKPDGVYKRKFKGKTEQPPEKICRPLVVKSAIKCVTDSDEVIDGRVLEMLTRDGSYREHVIARGELHQDKRALAGSLSNNGADIISGSEDLVAKYLCLFEPEEDDVRLSKTGWVPEKLAGSKLVFVLPNESTDNKFQCRHHAKAGAIRASGPLQDWVGNVYPLVSAAPLAMYEVMKALSAPLLAFVPVEPHENIYGLSSTGKTTLLQIGASVWGDGGGTHAQGYIQTWNTTSNALEIVATQFNDLPLYLDELGTYHGKQMQGDSYKLASQRGKGAMDRERNARASRSWNTRITSSGEVSISSKMQDDGSGRKKVPAAGALIRFLDRKLSGSPFNTAEQVKAIKKACGKHFGSLGPAFVKEIAARFNRIEFGKRISSLLDAAHKRLLLQFPAASAISTAERAMERFALTEAAGILLVEFGLVPGLTETAVSGAVNAVVAAWAPSAANLDDMPRAVEALREATIRDSDTRFKKGNSELPLKETPWTDELRAFGKVAGKIDTTRGRVSYTDEYIEEITGREAPDVADALDSAGWLIRDVGNGDRKRIKVALDGGKQIRLYTVKYEFLQSGDTMPEEGAKNFEDLL